MTYRITGTLDTFLDEGILFEFTYEGEVEPHRLDPADLLQMAAISAGVHARDIVQVDFQDKTYIKTD